jgi:hypothetical protein
MRGEIRNIRHTAFFVDSKIKAEIIARRYAEVLERAHNMVRGSGGALVVLNALAIMKPSLRLPEKEESPIRLRRVQRQDAPKCRRFWQAGFHREHDAAALIFIIFGDNP